jgi:hypothetical protein
MTIKCPYCKNEVRVRAGKLVDHWANPFLAANCIGSEESAESIRELNEAHERTREAVRRIR